MEEKNITRTEEDEVVEALVKLCQENQTRKILALLKESADLEEAVAKVNALLPQ